MLSILLSATRQPAGRLKHYATSEQRAEWCTIELVTYSHQKRDVQ